MGVMASCWKDLLSSREMSLDEPDAQERVADVYSRGLSLVVECLNVCKKTSLICLGQHSSGHLQKRETFRPELQKRWEPVIPISWALGWQRPVPTLTVEAVKVFSIMASW